MNTCITIEEIMEQKIPPLPQKTCCLIHCFFFSSKSKRISLSIIAFKRVHDFLMTFYVGDYDEDDVIWFGRSQAGGKRKPTCQHMLNLIKVA